MENILSGGLWIIPTVTGLAAVWSWLRFFFSKKTGNGTMIFATALTIATVVIIWQMVQDN